MLVLCLLSVPLAGWDKPKESNFVFIFPKQCSLAVASKIYLCWQISYFGTALVKSINEMLQDTFERIETYLQRSYPAI